MQEIETLGTEETTDAVEGGSSDASDAQGSEGAAQAASKQTPEPTPFHEHPRFKELVEQKNQALSSQKALETKLAEIEARFSKAQEPQGPSKEQTELDSLIADLKKVDPRLAAQIEAASKAQSSVQQLQQRLEQFEKQNVETQQSARVQTAVAKVNQLHESNKVSPELKQLINDKIDLLYAQGKLNLQNIEAEYAREHGAYQKMFEGLKRTERESYVTDKKKDAQVPTSQPKGAPAKPAAKKPTWSKDPETARAQIVSRFLKQEAAKKDAGSV